MTSPKSDHGDICGFALPTPGLAMFDTISILCRESRWFFKSIRAAGPRTAQKYPTQIPAKAAVLSKSSSRLLKANLPSCDFPGTLAFVSNSVRPGITEDVHNVQVP